MTESHPTRKPHLNLLQPLRNLPESPSFSEHHWKPNTPISQAEETETQTDYETCLRSHRSQ